MKNIYITGHKNPDTDTICSAIAYQRGFESLGSDAKAIRLGEISPETLFVLNSLKLEHPLLIKDASELGDCALILVDHNEKGQSLENRESLQIIEVIDHHRLMDFETKTPIDIRIESVGCTSTILYKIMMEKEMQIDKITAQLMLSAIISDTLLFKSPTCTDKDRDVAYILADISGLDINSYGMEMLKAGTDFLDKTVNQILEIDAKQFETNNGLFEVSQVSTVDIESVFKQYESDFKEKIKEKVNKCNLKLFILLVTDIIECNSKVLVIGEDLEFFEKQFNTKLIDNKAILKNVVSRKKQIVPYL